MTSAQFQSVSVESIKIDREGRQRKSLDDIEILADSIRRLGLIHPPVVTRDLVLVSGERRLTAIRSLGWSHVPVQYQDELENHVLRAIELEENVKRKNLPWQDECKAVLEYHQLRAAETPEWRLYDTGEALGLTQQEASARITVAKELENPESLIHAAPRYTTAVHMTQRAAERKASAALEGVLTTIGLPSTERPTDVIQNTSFLDWAPRYRGQPFNFIHCDFPYGIDAHKFGSAFTGGNVHGDYEDTKENYVSLIRCLLDNIDNIMADSGHLIFWLSMTHYAETVDLLSSEFSVEPYPLIWHKNDNAGWSPRPHHLPRRIYETALFCYRGDHPTVKMVSNVCSHPTASDRHMSEKPVGMLSHFFRMVVDTNTAILDPTAGSGSALRAAKRLGAPRLLGLEMNEVFAREANQALMEDKE